MVSSCQRLFYQKYNINIAPKVTSKLRAKPFYEQNTLSDLLKHIKVDTKSTDTIRTIHSAKGTQFDHVLIPFDHLSDFEMYVLDAKNYIDAENEETRIYYVGFSRAVQRLFINIPELNNRTIQKLNEMNVDYEFLNI